MSLPAILDAIRASGQAEILEIEEGARRQIQEMRANARLEGERIAEETCSAAVAPAIRERARILHRARLEALQVTGNKREGLVDAALDQTRGHLEGLRTDAAYPAVLQRLTQEALDELERSREDLGRAQLDVDPRDRELMESILSDIGLNLEVSYSLNCWGGLIAKSQDGRVVVINTLEVRLERAAPHLRRYLAGLFEGEHQESKFTQVVDMAAAS
jgi:V/A-type H+-transporting ATPase subunit E